MRAFFTCTGPSESRKAAGKLPDIRVPKAQDPGEPSACDPPRPVVSLAKQRYTERRPLAEHLRPGSLGPQVRTEGVVMHHTLQPGKLWRRRFLPGLPGVSTLNL